MTYVEPLQYAKATSASCIVSSSDVQCFPAAGAMNSSIHGWIDWRKNPTCERGNVWFCEHTYARHLWCIRRRKKALERERERNEHKSYTWIWLKNIISDSAIIKPNAAPEPFKAIVFLNKINAVTTRYPMFKNTEQEMPAMAASSIEFADLLLTMILSKTAPWDTAMMEKMDAMSALNAHTYHKPLRPTQAQHPILISSSSLA